MQGTPPHLDVTLSTSDGRLMAIESKFLEPYPRKTSKEFRETYFPATGRWADRALPACQDLAEAIRTGRRIFEYLDAQQLLKHVLGLANSIHERYALWYFWYDPGGEEGAVHRREIEDFSGCVDPTVEFATRSYQEVISRLAEECGEEHAGYVDYMTSRYGSLAF